MKTKRPTENIPFFSLCALAVPAELLTCKMHGKGWSGEAQPTPLFLT